MSRNYELSDAVKNYMMQYSKTVIMDRAIVSLEDGLKPSQRLELWSLYSKGVKHNKKRIKGLTATGEAMKYVPHGDSSVFEAMARMAQKDTFLYPLIDGKGNMGQHTGRDVFPSAPRYVEMRLTEFAEELFRNIEKDSVDFEENFDNTLKQPVVLPTSFPSILTFGSSGIAVGFASNIPSFNLKEVCQYAINTIEGSDNDYLVPDFATRGEIIYSDEELKKIEDTGDGKVVVRGTYYVETDIIIIDSIPFSTTREPIIEKILELAKEGKLKEVRDVRDGTDKNGMSIEIDIRKGTDVELLMAKIFKMTPLESNFNCNMNVIYQDKPVKLGVKKIIENWIDFRRKTVKRIAKHEIGKNQKELKNLQALQKVVLNIDKAINIIKSSKSDEETVRGLMNGFNIDQEEAKNVSNFRLKNLNVSFINEKTRNISELQVKLEKLNRLHDSPSLIDEYIVQDLSNIMKKYDKPRQTKIISQEDIKEINIDKEAEIEDYNLKLFVTKDLYLKKLPLTSMRGKFTNRLKEDDSFAIEEELTNTGEIIVFTDKRNVYKKRLHEIEDTKPSELGEYIPSMFDYEKDEKPLFALPLRKEFDQCIVLGFDDGSVAKIDSKAYYTKQNRQLLKNGYADKELIYVGLNSEDKLKAITSDNYAVVRDLSKINAKASRSANGNRFMAVNEGEKIVEYMIANEEDIDKYEIMSAGKGRRIR